MKICTKCFKQNPIKSVFCAYCGEKLPDMKQPDSLDNIPCTKCGTINIKSNRFCLWCGNPLYVPIDKRGEKRLTDYWYCDNDQILMKETASDHQFIVSKDLEKSLDNLELDGKIKREQRNLIKEIANKIYQTDPSTNFPLLTRVRCPICMQDSLAPVYFQPRHMETSVSPYQHMTQTSWAPIPVQRYDHFPFYPERLTVMSMISNGFDFISTNPKSLIIPFLIITIRFMFNFLGIELYDSSNIISWLFQGYFFEKLSEDSLFFSIGLLTDLIVESAFITTTLVFFVEIVGEKEEMKLNLTQSFPNYIEFFVKIILVNIAIDGLISLIIVITDNVNSYLYSTLLMDQMVSLMGMILVLAVLIITLVLLFIPMIMFAYVPQSLIIEKTNIPRSFIRSIWFARKYFLPTLVFFALLIIIPSIVFSIFPYEWWETGIFSIFYRFIEFFEILCLCWAFSKFKHTLNIDGS
ncbi:MAG: zinc ribbon domain-containing protein [Candidatus Hodarchaeota archaeon]